MEFFGGLDYQLNKSQLIFCLYNLGYTNNCNADSLDEESKRMADSVFDSLEKEKKVLLDSLVGTIKTIEGLKSCGLDLNSLLVKERQSNKGINQSVTQIQDIQQNENGFKSPPLNKEANHQK